jgi:hypothetical protein
MVVAAVRSVVWSCGAEADQDHHRYPVAVLRRSLILFSLLVALAATAATQPAFAAGSPATADCNSHGRLTQHYSVAQLHTALSTMSADVQEYTDCYNVIQNQLNAQVAGRRVDPSNSSVSGGSSFLSTPLLIALIVLLVGGGALAGVAMRRRGGTPGGS